MWFCGALCALAARAEVPPVEPCEAERPCAAVSGEIAWIFSDSLDLVGTMQADVSFPAGRATPYLALDARTAIERSISGLTFAVQSLDYRLEAGSRLPVFDAPGHHGLSVFLGQRGRENVDASGQPYVRYAGLGWDSISTGRLDWSIAAGGVLQDVEVDADAILRGSGRFTLVRGKTGVDRLEMEASVEALATSHNFEYDLAVGPRLRVGKTGETSFYAHYVHEETPVGLGVEGAMVGLDFSGRTVPGGERPARVAGSIGGGAGEGRGAGRFLLAFATPEFLGPLFIGAEVEGNILTAETTGELYYFYQVGLERRWKDVVGAVDYHHRSNHTLAEPNDTITSYDILEVGVDTRGFRSPDAPVTGRFGRIEGRARLGYVLDTSFDESGSWHARGAVRWFAPWRTDAFSPYVHLEADTGDVDRREYALGARVGPGLDVSVEYRKDEAWFGPDDTAVLFTASVVF